MKETRIGNTVSEAAVLLNAGEVVAVPTETVYGLAGSIRFPSAIETIFRVKARPSNDPLIVHVSDVEQLRGLVKSIPDVALEAMNVFWPGPMTLLFEKSDAVTDAVTSGSPFVAVRMPAHPMFLELLRLTGPLAAPSANPFGYVSPTTAQHVYRHFKGKIPYILDGGPCSLGLESTILKPENDGLTLLREGAVSREKLQMHLPKWKLHIPESQRNALPGGMEKHYSPSKSVVVTDQPERVVTEHAGKKIAVLMWSRSSFTTVQDVRIVHYSVRGSLDDAAEHLFALLRMLDESDCELIVAEKVPDEGIGRAINDRLRRAAAKGISQSG